MDHVVGQSPGNTSTRTCGRVSTGAERAISAPFARICQGAPSPSPRVNRRQASSLLRLFARISPPAYQITWNVFVAAGPTAGSAADGGVAASPPAARPSAKPARQRNRARKCTLEDRRRPGRQHRCSAIARSAAIAVCQLQLRADRLSHGVLADSSCFRFLPRPLPPGLPQA